MPLHLATQTLLRAKFFAPQIGALSGVKSGSQLIGLLVADS